MNCKFILKNNGENIEFNSKEELSSFIINNKNRLGSLNLDSSIKLSKDYSPQEETYAELLKLRDFTLSQDKSNDFGEKQLSYKDFISVTRAITMGEFWENGVPLVTGFNEEDYFNKLKESLIGTLNPKDGKVYNDDTIEEYIKDVKSKWKKLAVIGTAVHKISEIFFNDTSISDEEILENFNKSKEAKDVNFNNEDVIRAIKYVHNIHKSLLARYPDCKFIPEMKLRTKTPGGPNFVGKIDLLVVTSSGDVHIFDFKTSPTKYTDFSQIKELTFDYQLAFYRQMLLQNGINVRNTELGILPIELAGIDYDNTTVTNINEEPVIDIRTSGEGGTGYKKASYQKLLLGSGYVAQRVATLIPSRDISFSLNTDISERFDLLNKELFGYDSENNSGLRSKKTLDDIKSKVKQNDSGLWIVRDEFSNEINRFRTKDEAMAQVEANFKKNQDKKLYYAQDVANNYRSAVNQDYKSFMFPNDSNKTNNYNKLYGTYLKEGYKLKEDLLPHGILVFYHPSYKIIDFVYINNEDLSNDVRDLKYGRNGTKITGNLCHDKDTSEDTLDSKVGNIELMRLMVAVNEFMPSIADDYKVNDLKVINNFNFKIAFQNMNTLKRNFQILAQKANIYKPNLKFKNNFVFADKNNHTIQTTDGIERVLNKLDSILNDDTVEKHYFLNGIREELHKVNDKSRTDKIEKLIQLSKEVSDNALGYTGKILDPLSGNDENLTLIYYMIYDALREERGMYFEYQYSDIEKVSPHSELISPAQLSQIKVIREMQHKIIDEGRYRMQRRFNEEATPLKVFNEKYLKDNGSLDSSLNAYDSLIERHEGQTIIFRVKDPRTANLLPYQKEFLEKWLVAINKIRYPKTNGDMNSEEAQQYLESGEWFDIPLKEGGLINKGIKGVKSTFNDYMEKISNPIMAIEGNRKKTLNEQTDRFESYLNPLKIEGTDRDNFLADKGVNYFSRDLAEISASYLYHDVLEQGYDNMMPFLRAGIICTKMVDMFTKAEMTNGLKIMYEKFQSEVYKINHISKGAMPLYKAWSVLDLLANSFSLVNNPVAFVRELTTGRYSNYGRILTRFGGRDAPNVSELTKAYVFVDTQGVQALFSQNLMNAFNMRWNIGGRAMTEMMESHRAHRNPFLGIPFKSGSAYTMSQIPDYEHRMALFIAYLYKEGCFEAYSYDKNTQRLVYDMNKDKRFRYVKEYKRTGIMRKGEEENIAKYQLLLEEINAERENNGEEKLQFGDNLPDGISENKVKTIKNISNQIHGNMDSDTSMHFRRYFSGKIFTKFQTFLSAKIMNFTLKPGKYQVMEENYAVDENTGEPLYLKRVFNPETQDYDFIPTTDYNDPDCTKQRVVKYQMKQEAGTMYALLDMFEILSKPENRSERWMEFKHDDAKIAGLKFMIGDLILMLLMSILGSSMALPELRRKSPLTADMINAMAINPTLENNPVVLLTNALGIIDSPTISINKKILNRTINYLTKDDYTTKEYLYNFGFGKFGGFF